MKYKVLFLWLFLPFFGIAQQPVVAIEYSGLKKTKTSYLNHFIKTKIGESLDTFQLNEDVQRWKNLPSIGDVHWRLDTLATGVVVHFELKERFTVFPIVNFGNVTDNFWFQLGFADIHFLGRGMQLAAYYQNTDDRSSFNLFYKIPYIKGSKWGASFNILQYASREPLYFDEGVVFYNYTNRALALTSTYEFKPDHKIEFGGSYFVEKYAQSDKQELENPPGPEGLRQPKWLGKINHSFKKIDYNYFYLNGFENVSTFQTVYNTLDESFFHIFLNDIRGFLRIRDHINIAARLRFGISSNNDTPFAPFVIDNQVNIRGAGNRIDRGTAALILNLEHRQTILDKKKWAIQLVAFSDSGTWRNPGGDFGMLFRKETLRAFVGGGFRLIYKKAFDAILRIDYGIDTFNSSQHGLVVGIGQYF